MQLSMVDFTRSCPRFASLESRFFFFLPFFPGTDPYRLVGRG